MYLKQVCNNIPKGSFKVKISIALIYFVVHLEMCEAELRILGGRDALRDEFPFAVRLETQYMKNISGKTEYEYHRFCTGAALSPSWILTAAHCNDENIPKISLQDFMSFRLKKFARYNSYFPNELGQLSPITEIFAYPGYSQFKTESNHRTKSDIALYKTSNVLVSRYGKVSAVDYTSLVGHEATLLGFGMTNATSTEKPLQVLRVMFIKCDTKCTPGLFSVLCIVPRCNLKARSCGGDSGGPVVHASGIVGGLLGGWGVCSNLNNVFVPGRPSSIISMVSPAIDWISNMITNATGGRT